MGGSDDRAVPAGWTRRSLIGGGALAFTYLVAGRWRRLTPREARAEGAALRVLSVDDARTLEAAGETLAPGAARAGLVHYLDAQLAAEPAESLLILRYLDVPPPHADFYRSGATALDRLTGGKGGFTALDASARQALIGKLAAGGLGKAWPSSAPPAPLFHFVLRADAVDVLYGTPEGFARLGIDYVPHIEPLRPW
ncbi:MAG: gluconate 2-dehydrogenase subunit 3 family protein [Alphaproteobacteria bacterium]|nr:MAG: gluconate 2-dehydrogenase subunit 3 family protein [Alphaproteobacteria bacterium]